MTRDETREIRYYDKEKMTKQAMEAEVDREFPDAVRITWFDAFERMKAVIVLPSRRRQ